MKGLVGRGVSSGPDAQSQKKALKNFSKVTSGSNGSCNYFLKRANCRGWVLLPWVPTTQMPSAAEGFWDKDQIPQSPPSENLKLMANATLILITQRSTLVGWKVLKLFRAIGGSRGTASAWNSLSLYINSRWKYHPSSSPLQREDKLLLFFLIERSFLLRAHHF